MIYEVSKPFPEPNPSPNKDTFRLQTLEGGAFNILSYLCSPSAEEIEAWRQGTFRYGVFRYEDVPFFVAQFDEIELEYDAPLNVLKIQADRVEQWLADQGNAVLFFLIDADTNILKAQRLIGMEPEFMQVFKRMCAEQIKSYREIEEVERAIERGYHNHSTSDMLKHSKLYMVSR